MSTEWDQRRLDRLRKNEQSFRDHNDRRVAFEDAVTGEDELVPFVCECGDPDCIEGLDLTVEEYVSAHSAPNRYTVKPQHTFRDLERVAERHDRFWVVEKVTVQTLSEESL